LPVSLVDFSSNTDYVDSVYADANLFCYARTRNSPYYTKAAKILGSLIIQDVPLYISHLVIDEVWWAFLRAWYRSSTGSNLTAQICKRNPSIFKRFSNLLERNTDKILNFPNLNMVSSERPKDVIQNAKRLYLSENLMPRDSFHLAFAITNGIRGFITSDRDFDNLTLPNYNLTIYKY